MNQRICLTVVIPVFNAEAYIEQCLNSLLQQTLKSFNVVCVDDCSSDGSLSLLKKIAPQFGARMTILSNTENLGGGASRMRAVEVADTQYVTFLDSDDYLSNDYVERFIAEASTCPDIVVAGYTKDYGTKREQHKPVSMPWCLTTYSISCAKMYRRDFLRDNKVGFSKIKCGEDILFGLELFSLQPKVKVIDYCGYHYRYNDQSTTNTLKEDMEKNVAEIFSQFSLWANETSLNTHQKRVIEYTYYANMVNALAVYSRGCGLTAMKDKIAYFHDDCKKRFPDLLNNPLLRPHHAKGQSAKIRVSVSIASCLHRIGYDKYLYMLFSL